MFENKKKNKREEAKFGIVENSNIEKLNVCNLLVKYEVGLECALNWF